MKETGGILMSPREIDRLTVMERLKAKQLTQTEAAEQLRLCRRQIIRIYQKYQRDGAQGLVSGHRGKVSNNKLTDQIKERAIKLVKTHYPDFGPTFAHEKLIENHQLTLSVESLRKLMIKEKIWKGKKRKTITVHQTRTRRSQYGELVQIDGSPHAWFEDRGPRCTLLVFVDDATGRLMQLLFEPEESSAGYMAAIRQYLLNHGRPGTYYSDKHGIFRVNIKEAKSGTGETQLSRALRELDIELINANTPQAKGRVERMNATLQDRLVKELRLKGISDIESANKFLPEFIESYNKKFSVEPASYIDAHRLTIPDSKHLDLILCQRHIRTISKNLEVRYNNKTYQIKTDGMGYAMRRQKVSVHELHGKVTLVYKDKVLNYKLFDQGQRPTVVVTSKELNQHINRRKYKPAPNHPWFNTPISIRPKRIDQNITL